MLYFLRVSNDNSFSDICMTLERDIKYTLYLKHMPTQLKLWHLKVQFLK